MTELQMRITMLEAQRVAWKIEFDAKKGYDMNRDFQLQCSVLMDMIADITIRIDRLKYVENEAP